MPRSSSCRARWTGSPNCAGIAENGGRHCGAAAGVPADRARLRSEADPDTTGDAMAWVGTADLLRAVSGPVGADAGQGRPQQGAGRRRRWRAAALGAADVVIVSRAA